MTSHETRGNRVVPLTLLAAYSPSRDPRGGAVRRIVAVSLAACIASVGCTTETSSPTRAPSTAPAPTGSTASGHLLILRYPSNGLAEYFVANVDGSDERAFLPGEEFEARQLSPDSTRVAIVGPNEDGILTGASVDIDGRDRTDLVNEDPSLHLACGVWAPNQRLACEGFDESTPSRSGIYTVSAEDGGDLQRLTHERDVPCDYSPDGSRLAFIRTGSDEGVGRLMVMAGDGGKAESFGAEVFLSGIACDWSPDGRSILIGSHDGEIVLVSPDGGSSTLPGLEGFASGPTWSLDGAHIMFSMTLEGEQFDVYTVASDGTELTRITDSDLLEEAVVWLP
jgi:dipeptidyl aminopeptidase/acylaminoacyl peptidase